MEVVVERCAGIDVHKDMVAVCVRVPGPGDERLVELAEFSTFTINGIPPGSRASAEGSLTRDMLNDDNIARIRALNGIAVGRRQSLAQMAIAWALRDPGVTSVLIGASSVGPTRAKRRRPRPP